MKIYVGEDYKEMSRKAANIMSAQIILKPDSVIGLATGSTPIGIYDQLVKWYEKGDLDFSNVVSINLDEYKGLSGDNDQSYRYFMNKHLFDRINIDKNKTYGQIVTFQAPKLFKESVDNAVKLYSAGSTEGAILAEWDKVEPAFKKSLAALRVSAETPDDVAHMSLNEKRVFAKMFQTFDRLFAQIKSFTKYNDSMLEEYRITEEEYEKYVGRYQNVMEEIKLADGEEKGEPPVGPEEIEVDPDYELMAYSNTKIDYEYIIKLIQNIVTPNEDEEEISSEERQKQIEEVKQYIEEMRKDNAKVADIMSNLVYEIELDERKYRGQSILNIVENMKHDCIDKVVSDFCRTWYASKEDVMYAALHYRNGEIPNESVIKSTIDYTMYKEVQEKAVPKFKYYAQCMKELKKVLDEEIKPLIDIA